MPLPSTIQQLIELREAGNADSRREYNLRILETFKESDDYHSYDPATVSPSQIAVQLINQQQRIRNDLEAKGIIQRLHNLRPDTKRKEISDTTLAGYVQLLMVSDPHLYRTRTSQAKQRKSFRADQCRFLHSIPANVSMLNSRELKILFGQLTDHTFVPGETHPVRYRKHAICYREQLISVLATAQPVQIDGERPSYKIIRITQGPAAGSYLEFRYTNYFNDQGQHDRAVTVNLYDSREECQQMLNHGAASMQLKITKLQTTLSELQSQRDFYASHGMTKEQWSDFARDIHERAYVHYTGTHLQKQMDRYERSQDQLQYMNTTAFQALTRGMLLDVERSIESLTAMSQRFDQYAGS